MSSQVRTIRSSEFFRNISAAKRFVTEGGSLVITANGRPTVALIPFAEYQLLVDTNRRKLSLLDAMNSLPGGDGEKFDIPNAILKGLKPFVLTDQSTGQPAAPQPA